MRAIRLLIAVMLCLLFLQQKAFAQDLKKKISLSIDKEALPDVLHHLHENYGIRFSYLNNELAADTIYKFYLEEKPLSEVLDKLLEKTDAGYRQHNGQIIIKKGFPKHNQKPKATPDKDKEALAPPSQGKEEPAQKYSNGNALDLKPVDETTLSNKTTQGEELPLAEKNVEKNNVEKETTPDSLVESSARAEPLEPKATTSGVDTIEIISSLGSGGTTLTSEKPLEQKEKKHFWKKYLLTSVEGSDTTYADLHVGFIYPLSNHGTKAPHYVNKFSFHGLVGVAAGLDGLEISSLGNIEKDYVKGYQFAGLFNLVGNEVEGMQFSGMVNINGSRMEGGQFAGFLNYAGDEVKGMQASGFMNISGKSLTGPQLAGFMNVSGADVKGVQAAGFLNFTKNNLKGTQAAGFLNKADSVDGGQFAGFLNSATYVRGVQIAGFLNRATYVKGTQISFINIADSVEGGVPVGFFSFVKNGYRALELYAAEDFHANINFKTGVRKFYNIFAFGYELNDRNRWGIGYGVGAEWEMNKKFFLNTDLLGYYVNERIYPVFEDNNLIDWDLHSLYKLRLLATLPLGEKVALFGGPTYNIFVSQNRISANSSIGSDLVTNTFFDQTNRNTNVKMWLGFNAGLRF